MKFIIKELKQNDWFINGVYEKSSDSSLMFSSSGGGFELCLGNNFHLSLDIDSETGRCYGFYTLLDAIKFIEREITLPPTKKAKLYFDCDRRLQSSKVGEYANFKNICYWDKKNRIICIGDIDADAETIEFSSNTYAKVSNNNLLAIYLKLSFDI